MENRVGSSHGTQAAKKSRSMDLKSLYKPKVSKERTEEGKTKSRKRRRSSVYGNGEENSKKRSKKEVPVSNQKNVDRNNKKSLADMYNGGAAMGLKESGSNERSIDISLSLGDDTVRIPKRSRGFVRRKKFGAPKIADGQSASTQGLSDQAKKLKHDDSGNGVYAATDMQARCSHDTKETKDSSADLDKHVVDEADIAAKSDDLLSKKPLKNRRKKKNSKVADGRSASIQGLSDQAKKLKHGDSVNGVHSPSDMQAGTSHDTKEKNDSSADLDKHPENKSDVAAKSDDLLSKKLPKSRRKRKNLEVGARKFVQVTEPLDNDCPKTCNDLPEEDEENLEENAAMMLSSRFDPSCTGFGSNCNASAASSKSEPSFANYSQNDANCHVASDPASLDAANWKLRPRRQHNEKGLTRKRRYFYDIIVDELDPLKVLDKKIKLFWPLDEKWYYGLVNDYDEERKLHHIKYDDRDEEWVNLRKEKFKLLLLRCEVPSMSLQKKAVSSDKHIQGRKLNLKSPKKDESGSKSLADDNCVMDSEPIISWLARSKASTPDLSHVVKKQKTSPVSSHLAPSRLDDVKAGRKVDDGSFRRKKRKPNKNSALAYRLGGSTASGSRSAISLEEKKLPIVYVRRHRRKSTEVDLGKRDDKESFASDLACGDSVSSVANGAEAIDVHDNFFGESDLHFSSWSVADSSLQELNIALFKPGECRFELCIPNNFVVSQSFGPQRFHLFHAPSQQGMLMILWPKVHLEMLFVDSVVGLRFLLFEGSLKEALEFSLLVLTLFAPNDDEEKNVNGQVPATSISFKFVSVQGCGRPLVFAFYNFFKLRQSKWVSLDFKLMRRCTYTKQLPLSECTYDNIRLLQNGISRTPATSKSGPSIKRKCRPGICKLSVQKDASNKSASHSYRPNGNGKMLPLFALSFAAAPSFFRRLHLELLMEHKVLKSPALSVWEHYSREHQEVNCCCRCKDFRTAETGSSNDATSNKFLSYDEVDGKSDTADNNRSNNLVTSVTCGASQSLGLGNDEHWQKSHVDLDRLPSSPTISDTSQNTSSTSLPNGISVEIPQFNHVEKPYHEKSWGSPQPNDLASNGGGIIPSPNPTAPRTVWNRTRGGLTSGSSSHGYAFMKADSVHSGFVSGPKKPRTQVSYSLPLSGFEPGSKHRSFHHKTVPHKRIRRPNVKKVFDASQRNFDQLSCEANVLVTHGDRGWRECGAHVVLEVADQNEWKLVVKILGKSQFFYKAHQFLQPGSTNRYTHAMMWKGGKDWTLEFPDRGQWALFKEMHEECYNRNFRAALIKSIPIPGVRLIDENEDSGPEGMFVRSSSNYFMQIETDVEMALNPSRVLYDMDSDDEKWISENRNSCDGDGSDIRHLSAEVFERTMDMLEKTAYVQQRDQFSSDEIEELMNGLGPMELLKTIYEHWRQKRQKKGMPLIRHLQPPLWERYQQQVREWELNANKANSALPSGCKKAPANEKPPMFAFCMKPRGLEVPNKGSKQRSHKKISVSAHNHTYGGDHDGIHAYGRRANGYAYRDERAPYTGHSYGIGYLEDYSPRARFSPRDAYFSMSNEGYHYPALRKSKKFGSLIDRRPVASMGYRNYAYQRNPQLEGPMDYLEADEFIVRGPSSSAQHARKMANLKRERARKMFNRADLAIHKAASALMIVDAMKSSLDDMDGGL